MAALLRFHPVNQPLDRAQMGKLSMIIKPMQTTISIPMPVAARGGEPLYIDPPVRDAAPRIVFAGHGQAVEFLDGDAYLDYRLTTPGSATRFADEATAEAAAESLRGLGLTAFVGTIKTDGPKAFRELQEANGKGVDPLQAKGYIVLAGRSAVQFIDQPGAGPGFRIGGVEQATKFTTEADAFGRTAALQIMGCDVSVVGLDQSGRPLPGKKVWLLFVDGRPAELLPTGRFNLLTLFRVTDQENASRFPTRDAAYASGNLLRNKGHICIAGRMGDDGEHLYSKEIERRREAQIPKTYVGVIQIGGSNPHRRAISR
jgi:hypothetical protein